MNFDKEMELMMKAHSTPQHEWVRSTHGHGDAMCRHCLITNREAAAIGLLNECRAAEWRKKKPEQKS